MASSSRMVHLGAIVAQAAVPTPPLDFQPNILLLFPDEWRFDWDGFRKDNGNVPLHMPNMRSYAARGTRFQHAYVPAPVCAPSRSALAAGREYDHAGVPDNFSNDYPINQTTFYTQLQKAGYHTMMTGKDDLTKATQIGASIGEYLPYGAFHMSELGISDGIRHCGKMDVVNTYPEPHDYYGYYLRNRTVQLENGTTISAWDAHASCFKHGDLCQTTTFTDDLYEDNWVAANAIALLQRKPKDKPWFMHVSFPGPHPPFIVTSKMADSVVNRTWPQPVDSKTKDICTNDDTMGEPSVANTRCNYAAELENLDKLFGSIVDTVDSLGELEHTLVCISSDHGDMLGDHNKHGKTVPWEASASVPLLCFGGSELLQVKAGAVVDKPVATLDLAGTFIDYAGGELAEGMTTQSLRPILEGTQVTVRPFISSGLDNWRMVVQQHNNTWFKFVCCDGKCKGAASSLPGPTDGYSQFLFDINADQFDMQDLSQDNPEVVDVMRALLPSHFACGGPGQSLV